MADPRVLDPRINGQLSGGYQVPPSQDPYYGIGMSAQPSLIEKLTKLFFNPNDPGIGPAAMEAPAGIVLNARNAEIIKNAIMRLPQDASPLEIASRFVSTKYPKLSGLTSKILRHPNTMSSKLASFNDLNSVLNIYKEAKQGVPEFTNTLGHELTHAAQFKRTPEIFNEYALPSKDIGAYWAQPSEVAAVQGGKTATDALKKFASEYLASPDTPSSQLDIGELLRSLVGQTGYTRPARDSRNVIRMPNL